MTEPIQPHDRFFRSAFSKRETVEDIVFSNLPEIAAHLMPGTFENTDETFVNEELRKYVSDMLYRAKLRDGEDAYIYILFEHKSRPEPQVAFDLLRYMVRIWERFRDEGTEGRFPHIIPIVFYHGKEEWKVGTNFASLFQRIEGLGDYVPSFTYCLYDLSRYDEEQIRGAILSRALLLLMKHIYREDFGDRFVRICGLLGTLGEKRDVLDFLQTAVEYVLAATERITEEQLREGVKKALPSSGDEIMPTLYEQILERGREEGLERGREEGLERGIGKGRMEGLREAILLGLELKFGDPGLSLAPLVEKIDTVERMKEIKNMLRKAETLDQVKSLL